MTFAFIERQAATPFCPDGFEPAAIANPLSEKFAVLRPSMLPGLVDSCSHNRRRGRKDVRLFETGSRFTASGEGRAVGLAWSGAGDLAHWSAQPRAVDFFDIKGVRRGPLLRRWASISSSSRRQRSAFLAPGRSAMIQTRGTTVGDPRSAHAEHRRTTRLSRRRRGLRRRARPRCAWPRVPRSTICARRRCRSSRRSCATSRFCVADTLPAAAVRGTIRSAAPSLLQSVVEFDRYQGKGIPDGRLSLSLRLTFRSAERTLTDDEVDGAMNEIVAALEREHAAQRR